MRAKQGVINGTAMFMFFTWLSASVIGLLVFSATPPATVKSPDGQWTMTLPAGVTVVETSFTPTNTLADLNGYPACQFNSVKGFDLLPCGFVFPTVGKRWVVCKSLPNGKCKPGG